MPQRYLTLSTRFAHWGDETTELHVDVHLHPQEQSHLQQDQLELPDTWDGSRDPQGCTRGPCGDNGGTLRVQSLAPPKDSLMWSSVPVQKCP